MRRAKIEVCVMAVGVLLTACAEKEPIEGGSGAGIKAQVAECATPHAGFFSADPGWSRRSPLWWSVGRPVVEQTAADRSVSVDGESSVIDAPLGRPYESGALLLPAPDSEQALVVPAGALEADAVYGLRARVKNDVYFSWEVAEVRDSAGDLRILHLSGEVQEGVSALQELGWQVQFTPACWTANCYDPVVHHDLTLSDGTHSWSVPDRSDATVTVDGRSFRVINDAAAVPDAEATSGCADVPSSYWNVAIIALDR